MKKISTIMLFASALSAALPIPNQVSANFHQTVVNLENNQTLRYSGLVFIKFPNEAKWIYKQPVEKIICLMQNRAWVIEPELEQATLFQLNKTIPLLKILKRAKQVAKSRYEAVYEDIKYIIITDTQEQIKQIEYLDELDNRVILAFKNVKTKPFDKSLLKCTIPDDYDIIDGRY